MDGAPICHIHYHSPMPSRLKRYQANGDEHFVTFSCYRRLPYLDTDAARTVFLERLESLRAHHQFFVSGTCSCRSMFTCSSLNRSGTR